MLVPRYVEGPSEPDPAVWDAQVTALGFETRARAVAERYPAPDAKRLAIPFPGEQQGACSRNRAFYEEAGFEVSPSDDPSVASALRALLDSLAGTTREPHICVDISSFDRSRLARILEEIERTAVERITVDFAYITAVYHQAPKPESVIEFVGPASPRFAGWSSSPAAPTVAVVGLGYEYERALGAVQYLDPADILVLTPTSFDPRYDRDVARGNADLISSLSASSVWSYSLADPYETQRKLDGLVRSSMSHSKPVLVPFGPKLFSLMCLLVAMRLSPEVAVWRVSSGSRVRQYDAQPDKTTLFHRVVFESPASS